jgi:hypothetical protein
MRSLFAVVGFLVAMQFTAVAQEEFRALDGRPLTMSVLPVDKGGMYNEMTIAIRIPFLGGDLSNEGDKWKDFFESTGIGLGLDGSYLWAVSDKVALGIYTALHIDFFGGKDMDVDIGGGVLLNESFDDLVMTRFIVGGRIRETFGKFFMDQNIGFGFATYSGTDATAGGVSVGVIESSVVFAFEIGFRLGIVVSRVVDLGMGLAYNYNGAPDVSSDLLQVDPGLSYRSQSNTVLSFFINLNF